MGLEPMIQASKKKKRFFVMSFCIIKKTLYQKCRLNHEIIPYKKTDF